jgi:hypothetical protein
MRISNNRAFVNQVVIGTLVAVGVSGSVGIGSVWLRHQISVTAAANKALENRLAEVERLTQQTGTWIAEEQDVTALLRRNSEWRLGLMPPQDGQVQRITEDSVAYLTAKRDSGLFRDRAPFPAEVEFPKTLQAAGSGIASAEAGTQSGPAAGGMGRAMFSGGLLQGVVRPGDDIQSVFFRVAVRR